MTKRRKQHRLIRRAQKKQKHKAARKKDDHKEIGQSCPHQQVTSIVQSPLPVLTIPLTIYDCRSLKLHTGFLEKHLAVMTIMKQYERICENDGFDPTLRDLDAATAEVIAQEIRASTTISKADFALLNSTLEQETTQGNAFGVFLMLYLQHMDLWKVRALCDE